MAKIIVNNPRQVINGGAKKYYFKVKGLGGPKGDKGDKGDTGSQGPQGPQGNAATVSIGSTTTLPVGYDATVTNSGSIYNAVLNFGIPQGPRGPQGATGATGAKGDKGDQGNPGPQGEKGTNATVYVGTTSTLNPGSQATVYNSGTDSNAVLNFGIPKGEKGDTGPMPTIAQTTGQAIDQVMSQKATTDALNTKQATITSSNKLSADLVDDTSTTNKFVTASDITTWNGKQDALTAGTGIDITGGVISTPAIVPEVVAELPTTGAEGKLYLTPKAHTTSTATGNPITATVAEEAGALESFQLDGDTYQQSYTGKNLFDAANADIREQYILNDSGVEVSDRTGGYTRNYSKVEPSTGYILSGLDTIGGKTRRVYYYDENKGFISRSAQITTGSPTLTFTTPANCYFVNIQIFYPDDLDTSSWQLEAGSSATAYEPYVGGQASPNPSYPQPIQTVTGEQTVTINSTAYPISLGTIELCKLGTYQDYIYKDGDSWKVHKATKKTILTDSTSFTRQIYGTNTYTTNGKFDGMRRAASETVMLASSFGAVSWNDRTTANSAVIYQNLATPNEIYLEIRNTSFATLQDLTTYLGNSPVSVYYELATPADTVITDQTLIAQLEAVLQAKLQASNTITNTATGSNLAGDMEIGYYGYNPTNRYDKFIWLDINNNYEQIGGE